MALTPKNKKHASQIEAGIVGRKKGHKFESVLATTINQLPNKTFVPSGNNTHIFHGNPATHLLQYIANNINITIMDARALWLGGLATSGKGDVLLGSHGSPITKSKSDVLIQITTSNGTETVGVSVKTCNKTTPTNDQMFFTTARAFCQLLRTNEIIVSEEAERGLLMFCGDIKFRPIDILPADKLRCRTSDPKRFYWEELSRQAQQDWKEIFDKYQDKITMLLFQKAYKDDPYSPTFLLHQTVRYDDFNQSEIALFSMDEIVKLSREHSGYVLSEYKIKKGTHKNDTKTHLAPRFGFIQFQRGGQKQHPTQLQFNLKAGYFRHI